MNRTASRQTLWWALALWALVALDGVAVLAGAYPALAATAATVQTLVLFVVFPLHASRLIGWRGTLVFFVVGYVIALLSEALSIRTGFPFGFFAHHDEGFTVLGVPPVVPVAYAATGWFAWVLAKSIVGRLHDATDGAARWTAPVLAALILAGFDAVGDASVTTLVRPDTYTFPGGYNGVPFTNFVGWIVTGWAIFQVFAVLEARVSRPSPASGALTSALNYQLVPVIVWALVPVRYFIDWRGAASTPVPIGDQVLTVADIHQASASIGLMTMVMAAVAAAARLLEDGAPRTRTPVAPPVGITPGPGVERSAQPHAVVDSSAHPHTAARTTST